MTKEQIDEMNSYWWWHQIKLPDGTVTPGHCSHGTGTDVETRFGLPKDMTGKCVLDIGGWDGLFSFEAENRGSKDVTMIDIYQAKKHNDPTLKKANGPFQFAKKMLNSEVRFEYTNLHDFCISNISDSKRYTLTYDYIFYFGVLYHVDEPLEAVKQLVDLTKYGGTILLETTITDIQTNKPILEYRPNYQGDPTNKFYVNKEWIKTAFIYYGAKSVEQIWTDGQRSSFRITL
jgi:tRNA (mo5U34)-methyltransferase